mmetsp:Transcript_42500/g.79620  ORF Transcript_42500/g.79620 Transcript_42500/m.79620 type:complete len:210 (-) Transcript_42500:2542-3171(-)
MVPGPSCCRRRYPRGCYPSCRTSPHAMAAAEVPPYGGLPNRSWGHHLHGAPVRWHVSQNRAGAGRARPGHVERRGRRDAHRAGHPGCQPGVPKHHFCLRRLHQQGGFPVIQQVRLRSPHDAGGVQDCARHRLVSLGAYNAWRINHMDVDNPQCIDSGHRFHFERLHQEHHFQRHPHQRGQHESWGLDHNRRSRRNCRRVQLPLHSASRL